MTVMSFREQHSKVWRVGDYVYKSQPKYLMDNEIWCMDIMMKHGYVPEHERLDLELMRMEYVESEPITDVKEFAHKALMFVRVMKREGIRHGNLTPPHIFPVNNSVVVIDWAESRVWADPRPDKREEGDLHLMKESIKRIIRP